MSKTKRCIMGIDCGVTGGLAFLWPNGELLAYDIPVVDKEVNVDALADQIRLFNPIVAIIERASSRPGQGVSSTFRYGQSYGAIRACVATLGISHHLVAATKWKKYFNLDSDKEKSRELAIRMWPGAQCFGRKKDHGRAEAALLAKYGSDVLLRKP